MKRGRFISAPNSCSARAIMARRWERISPDLTTNDPEKQKQEESGGVTVDNSDAEMHTTIYSISESPRDGQTIWVGTDDGNLQLTRDGGKTLDERGRQCARPSEGLVGFLGGGEPFRSRRTRMPRSTGTLFGDMDPHVYKTTDYGKTWTPIVAGTAACAAMLT